MTSTILIVTSDAAKWQPCLPVFGEHGADVTFVSSLDACKEADLLILDDLGTEYISQLTISVLYELINTRMLCHRPTIYTSNIVDSSIFEARYTEKVASRMLGGCKMFMFMGDDQRMKQG